MRRLSFGVTALDHLVITCRDVEVSAAWYSRVLGMTRETFGPHRRTSLRFGQQKINLRPETATQEEWFCGLGAAPGTHDLCFLGGDAGDDVAHLRECGVAVELGPVPKDGRAGADHLGVLPRPRRQPHRDLLLRRGADERARHPAAVARPRAAGAQRGACCGRAAAALGVGFRPHFKTAKSVEVALLSHGGAPGPATVSTMKEAEALAAAGGSRDILLAATAIPGRLPRAEALRRNHGTALLLVVDSPEMAGMLDAAAGEPHDVLVEVDCGEHRAGRAAERAVAVARAIHGARHLRLAGVMTHGGHSYGTDDPARVADIAEAERAAAVAAAEAIREAGLPAAIVSVGSTPTLLHARHLEGVTEARAGVSLFWDLAQMSRGMCAWDDLALSVLSTVIGHNRAAGTLVLDAGALALSKDVTANAFAPETGYGRLGDAATGAALPLHVSVVHQEHGSVPVPDESWFARLPVGSLVRVYPNHACLTAAGGYGGYDVLGPTGQVENHWTRVDGWH